MKTVVFAAAGLCLAMAGHATAQGSAVPPQARPPVPPVPMGPRPGGPPMPPPSANPREAPDAEPAVESAIPEAYGLYRYEPLWKNSPFMLETPVGAVVTESFAKDLAVTSVSVINGSTRVSLVNVKTRETQRVTDDQANEKGIVLVSVEPHADPSKVVAEIAMNDKTAKVNFDTVTLQGKPTAPRPANPATPAAGARPGAPVAAVPGRTTGNRTPATRRRIVLPKSVTGGQQPGAPQVSPTPVSKEAARQIPGLGGGAPVVQPPPSR